ncbi:MAG TPA: large conductance mechanosensitive channel protein MscL [Candidatus Aquilonibacter sp.]|nr:large conductance mechanosensitive channel protein MscL [Candidatus Aquilonibacter sp.]
MATSLDTRKLKEKEVNVFKGFRDFVLRGNVMDLAVAVIIGAAFTAIVTALTENIIKPLLGATIGKPDFGYLVAYVHGGKIMYGNFITAVINFLILAFVVYFFLVLPTQWLLKKFQPQKAEPPTTKPCPQCKSDIPIDATRCKFCTQPV